MKHSIFFPLVTALLLIPTNTSGMDTVVSTVTQNPLRIRGCSIPINPQEELTLIVPDPANKEVFFKEAINFEKEKNYKKAADSYKIAGVSGHAEAFICLAYLYEGSNLITSEGRILTVEERRLKDAIAAFYLEKAGELLAVDDNNNDNLLRFSNTTISARGIQLDLTAVLEEDDPEEIATTSLTDIINNSDLSLSEKFLKIGFWYENQRNPNETISQKRLRYAYAARYYEEAALWNLYPLSFASLGHTYFFGKGIDISDSEMQQSAQLQAQEYYDGQIQGYSYVPDCASQFMMGFLYEQDQTSESHNKAISCYQDSASKNYAAAAFRLGVRLEQGQGENISEVEDFYKQAEVFYNQAKNGIKPPTNIATLISMPDSFEDKIALVKKYQLNCEKLTTPTYVLLDHLFCSSVRTNSATILMPYWVDISLTHYAQKHGLGYKQNHEKTKECVNNISRLLSGSCQTQTIPDLTSQEQKLLNMEGNKTTFNNPQAKIMREMQIRQLLSQEDQKWLDIPESETKKYAQLWLEQFYPLAKALNDLSQTFAGDPFLETVFARIRLMPVQNHKPDIVNNLWPQEYEENLTKELARLKEEAQMIFSILEPCQRSLSLQLLMHKNAQRVKNHIGKPLSHELLQEILLAHKLMMAASLNEHCPEKIIKHFQSARSLKNYALSHDLSIEDAKAQLEQKAKKTLSVINPHLHDYSIIGYDILIKIIEDMPSIIQPAGTDPLLEAARLYRAKQNVALSNGDFDQNWARTQGFKLSVIAGSSESSLSNVSKIAKTYIDANQSTDQNIPCLNLPAITYEDPNIGLYGNIVLDCFSDLIKDASDIHDNNNLNISEQEIYQSLLDGEILNIESNIKRLADQLPPETTSAISDIVAKLETPFSPFQKIERKQNFIFVLKKCADWQNINVEQIILATQEIIQGTLGRCPDGQADFCQNWIVAYILNNVTHNTSFNNQTSIKLCLSLLLQNYKSIFIEQHTSPFLIGARKNSYDASEDRTAMRTLLTQVLRLPLGLIGSYSVVLYPFFATRCLVDSNNSIQITALMKRFLQGGDVTYKDLRVTKDNDGKFVYLDKDLDGSPEYHQETISFDALSLKTLGQLLRFSFTSSKDRKQAEHLPGLLPKAQIGFVFPLEKLEEFLQYDPILACSYSTFIDSGYKKGNKFFDSKAAFDQGYNYQYILKDAALLRILEVGGYVKVPVGFYENLSEDWKFD